MIKSPLTNNDVVIEKRIKTDEIIKFYMDSFALDVKAYFQNIQELCLCQDSLTGYRFFYPAIEGDSKFYEYFQNFDWYYMSSKWEFDVALKYFTKGDQILEIGCGKGEFLKKASKLNYDIEGIDLNENTVEQLKNYSFKVYNQTIERFSGQAVNKFDVVISFQVLEHIYNVNDFLTAALRVLKPCGKLIISVPNNDSFIKHSFPSPLNSPPHHVGLWTKKSLVEIGRLYDLEVKEGHYEPLQDYHFDWYYETLKKRVVSKFGFLGKIILFPFRRKRYVSILSVLHKFIKGHTVLVVFQKKRLFIESFNNKS